MATTKKRRRKPGSALKKASQQFKKSSNRLQAEFEKSIKLGAKSLQPGAALPGQFEEPVSRQKRARLMTVKFRPGEPLPTPLEKLVHDMAQKAAREILDRQNQEKASVVRSWSADEVHKVCSGHLDYLNLGDRTVTIARLLSDHENHLRKEISAYSGRQEACQISVDLLRAELNKVQAVQMGNFALLKI